MTPIECKRIRCNLFFSMNSIYEREKSYILLNTSKHSKMMQLSISWIKMMSNYKENVSENRNAHAKLALFPNMYQNKFPKECKIFFV
jgi:hypothetical protein